MNKTAKIILAHTPSGSIEFIIDGPVLEGDGPDRFFMTEADAIQLRGQLDALLGELESDRATLLSG
jgi:hypothetical protein